MPVLDETAATRPRWADLLALPDDDRRELIDGELLEIEVPTEAHEHIVATLGFFLVGWARAHGGRVLASGYKVRIRDDRGVMPDLSYYCPETAATLPQAGMHEGHPDLVVELISPSSRSYDRVRKLRWYAEIGVPEYWIIDPEARSLDRLLLKDARYSIDDALLDDAVFSPARFEGLAIPLAELWTPPG